MLCCYLLQCVLHTYYVQWLNYDIAKDIMSLKTAKGLALQDILTEVHQYVHRSQYNVHTQEHAYMSGWLTAVFTLVVNAAAVVMIHDVCGVRCLTLAVFVISGWVGWVHHTCSVDCRRSDLPSTPVQCRPTGYINKGESVISLLLGEFQIPGLSNPCPRWKWGGHQSQNCCSMEKMERVIRSVVW